MKRLKFETTNELELFCLNYLVSKHDIPISEIKDSFDADIVDVAEELSEFLVDLGFAKVYEEDFECDGDCRTCQLNTDDTQSPQPKQ